MQENDRKKRAHTDTVRSGVPVTCVTDPGWFLCGAVDLATLARLPPAVIGLTAVAAGATTHELAARRLAAGSMGSINEDLSS